MIEERHLKVEIKYIKMTSSCLLYLSYFFYFYFLNFFLLLNYIKKIQRYHCLDHIVQKKCVEEVDRSYKIVELRKEGMEE